MATIETLIIGGGQAGLAVSYWLTQHGREHLVLEKAAQPASAWRRRVEVWPTDGRRRRCRVHRRADRQKLALPEET